MCVWVSEREICRTRIGGARPDAGVFDIRGFLYFFF